MCELASKESCSSFGMQSRPQGRESRTCWAESAQPPPPLVLKQALLLQVCRGGKSQVYQVHRGHRCVCVRGLEVTGVCV